MRIGKIKIVLLLLILILCSCGVGEEEWDNCHKLKQITVYTAAKNPDNICIVSYPHNYVTNGSWKSMEETVVSVDELSKEDGQYLWNYIVGLEMPDYMNDYELYMNDYKGMYEGHVFTCAMMITYEDSWGNERYISRYCFDTFPEGWKDFVGKVNEVCGDELLTTGTELQEMNPEYLKEVTGITEAEYYPMTLQEIIDILNLDMFDFAVDNRGMMDSYEINDMLTIKYLPREIKNVESTPQEFGQFVSAFVRDNFGTAAFDDLDIQYFDRVSYCSMEIDDEKVYFFRSCCINDESTNPWIHKTTHRDGFQYYMWMETVGDMTWNENFYYNADGKYGMVLNSNYNPAIIDAFAHTK